MEYLVMECGLSYAVVLDSNGRFLQVPNLGYAVGETRTDIVVFEEKPAVKPVRKQLLRWSTIAACLCIMLAISDRQRADADQSGCADECQSL